MLVDKELFDSMLEQELKKPIEKVIEDKVVFKEDLINTVFEELGLAETLTKVLRKYGEEANKEANRIKSTIKTIDEREGLTEDEAYVLDKKLDGKEEEMYRINMLIGQLK